MQKIGLETRSGGIPEPGAHQVRGAEILAWGWEENWALDFQESYLLGTESRGNLRPKAWEPGDGG